MEQVTLDDKNAQKDARHLLGTSIKQPATPGELMVARCQACRKLLTEHEWQRYGVCPNCRGRHMVGGIETPWESLKLKLWMITESWQITGEWKNPRPLWKRILGLGRSSS